MLLLWHFQSFRTPEPMHTLAVATPAFARQQCGDPTVAKTRVAQRQLPHPPPQGRLPVALLRTVTLRRSRLTDRPTNASLRQLQLLLHLPYHASPLCRADYFPSNASLRIDLSSSSSATTFFRRTFSFSSTNIRLASSICTPP